MRQNILSIVIAFLVFGTVIGLSIWFFASSEPDYLQGQVEARQINVAPKVPGRVKTIYKKEGEYVKAGELLLELESTELDAKLAQAQAAKSAALAQSNKAQRGARSEQIQGAYNLWQQAKVAAELAEKTYQRVSNLYQDKVLPAQKKDEAYTQMIALQKQEQAALSQYEMAKNGARSEDKEAASALVAQAQGVITEVEAYKEGAKVFAPADAEIQSIIPNEGEIVNAGYPVMNLIDTNDQWVVFNIREDKMKQYKIGNKFKGIVPALGNQQIEMEVKHIAVQADFATWTATKAKGDFDRKTFAIKAYPTAKIADLRPGMSVLIAE
ncbi:HlyD family secretion protein [Capnocytophaga canimorsus]|uniref:36 kDa antigen n=2 Tax=Capnocytophaga canimorsus TaxID=28188 RepID=F9YQR9_CAPCC|nr:biotin/lipoyl-binding protein [Capnocytophaga canimorsus]AEK22356.1 36 kDa antigen [Capnocytophaga canimorsus Cc5]ATA92183.1 hemolysin secretion protein D [Capnocytophaga canimorsus]WGU69704.1 biotin/lipoyl-binding protein [Capnocytophaga canimorsus]CEN52673.1 36 kDa antigen [Capnocytophaga canimorsus]GIM57583.1 hemolysin secretion protein D [Capnocytophaga canimorsus]